MDKFYTRYCGRYVAIHTGISLALMAVAFFGVEFPSVVSLIVAMVSGFVPGSLFVKDNGRLPEKSERRRFAAVCLAAVSVLSLIFAAVILVVAGATWEDIFGQLRTLPPLAVPAIMLVILAVFYFVIGSGFKTGAKIELKGRQKKGGGV